MACPLEQRLVAKEKGRASIFLEDTGRMDPNALRNRGQGSASGWVVKKYPHTTIARSSFSDMVCQGAVLITPHDHNAGPRSFRIVEHSLRDPIEASVRVDRRRSSPGRKTGGLPSILNARGVTLSFAPTPYWV